MHGSRRDQGGGHAKTVGIHVTYKSYDVSGRHVLPLFTIQEKVAKASTARKSGQASKWVRLPRDPPPRSRGMAGLRRPESSSGRGCLEQLGSMARGGLHPRAPG